MANKPRIRFKGFTEDWEQCKFGELFEYERPDAYIVKSDNYNDVFNMPVLTANKAFILGYTNEENSYNKPSIIFDDFTLDKKYVDFPYMLKSSAIKILTSKNQHNLRFLFERLNSTRFEVLGHARHYISIVQNTSTLCPSIEEEFCISNLLTRFDEIITLHQCKLEKLKLTKKALLQKLFPKNGKHIPEIRFKGFTDAWEQRKLGDIATITGGGTPSTNISEYWNGDIDWYSPVEIGENRYVSRSTRKITKLGLEKSSAKILPVGTVLFTSRAGIGNTAILQAEGCTNQGFQSITPNSKELDTYFLYTMTPKLKRYGEVTGAGSTFVEVSGKQMEQMNLMIPSLEEQKHVSQLFELMDDAITLHQRKLERLQEVKKGLLQKMFV